MFYFGEGVFRPGYDIGSSFGAQKALPRSTAGSAAERLRSALRSQDDLQRLILTSKKDRLFPVRFGNPATYQRLVLGDGDR